MNDFLTGSNANLQHRGRSHARQASRPHPRGQRPRADPATPRRSGWRTEQLRGRVRRRRRARPANRAPCSRWRRHRPYDPNLVEDDFRADPRKRRAHAQPAAPLLNRATAGPLHPGLDVQGRHRRGGARVGPLHARDAVRRPRLLRRVRQAGLQLLRPGRAQRLRQRQLQPRRSQNSINSVFCDIGKDLGPQAILEQARRFGFYEVPPLETPEDERVASGLYRRGELFFPDGSECRRSGTARVSARSGCSRRRCRWRWSPPVSPTAVSSWSRSSSTGS